MLMVKNGIIRNSKLKRGIFDLEMAATDPNAAILVDHKVTPELELSV